MTTSPRLAMTFSEVSISSVEQYLTDPAYGGRAEGGRHPRSRRRHDPRGGQAV